MLIATPRIIKSKAFAILPDFSFEEKLWQQGLVFIAGMDEAGRGALAGPVAAGALIFDGRSQDADSLFGVRDSKQMSPASRAFWAEQLKEISLTWGVGFASSEEIDQLGIAPATRLAMCRAVDCLEPKPQHLLVDFISLPECLISQSSIVKGDTLSLSIAAASILAKTARDSLMVELDQLYPGYDFYSHKGYGTQRHLEALARLGPSPIHRRSFAPIIKYDQKGGN